MGLSAFCRSFYGLSINEDNTDPLPMRITNTSEIREDRLTTHYCCGSIANTRKELHKTVDLMQFIQNNYGEVIYNQLGLLEQDKQLIETGMKEGI